MKDLYILGEPCVISIGSIHKVLKEKMYNRCRRGHLLLSAALQGFHFKKLTDNVNIESSAMTESTEWSDKDDKQPSASLLNFVKRYRK